MKTENCNSRVIIVSGPSGVGKSTICKKVVEQVDNVNLSVSVTTRTKTAGEIDGQDYRFVSREKFQELIDKNQLLEYAEVFGHLYGTSKEQVDWSLQAGESIILEIDIQGAKKTKPIYPDAVTIFILPPTHRELRERMDLRGREGDEAAEQRLNKAGCEIDTARQYYEYMVVNDDFEQAVNKVIQIIRQNVGVKKC